LNATGYLFDTNLWIALSFTNHPHHLETQREYASATPLKPAVFCRPTETSFLRLSTTPAILRQYGEDALTNDEALDLLRKYLALPNITIRDEPAGTVPLWHRMAARPTSSPKVWADAYLAAFAIAGRFTFTTFDRGFAAYLPYGLDLRLLPTP
jgi:toxin-antitoxin system PIN domain toxin